MKKEEIHLWDIKRILFGQAPPDFLFEVFIRSLIIYVVTIIVMRWMGKRMNGQHSIVELSVMVMMGAIIAVPMQTPDRGILQGIVVLFVTLFLLRSFNWLGYKNSSFEKSMQGEVITLVKDGILQKKELSRNKITNQQVFEILRSKNIYNLGRIKRLYLEGCGIFSVYHFQQPKAGLPLYPPIDESIYQNHLNISTKEKACKNCGFVEAKNLDHCTNCGNNEWTKAIV
jgi:uncharacterized membrane protein YcaP (DUF421 family)